MLKDLEHLKEYKIIDKVPFNKLKIGDVFIFSDQIDKQPILCEFIYDEDKDDFFTLEYRDKKVWTYHWRSKQQDHPPVYLTNLTVDFVEKERK